MSHISCVHDFFDKQVEKGRWIRSLVPSFLLDSFKSRIDESVRLTGSSGDNVPPYACTFSGIPADGALMIVADEDGQLALMDTTRRTPTSIISSWQCHTNAIFDVKWLPNERTLITASGDQTLGLHDLLTRTRIESFVGHFSSIRAVDYQLGNPCVFASASRDGSIRLWDRRNKKITKRRGISGLSHVACLNGCHQPESGSIASSSGRRSSKRTSLNDNENSWSDQSVTSVSFGDNYIASSGSTDGKIKLWDIRKMSCRGIPSPKYTFRYSGDSRKKNIGFSYLFIDHLRSRIFAVCRDQALYQYSLTLQSDRHVFAYRGHQSSSFYIRASLSPDGQYLACGSGDCNGWIYSVNEAQQTPTLLRGFEGEVTDVRWSPYDPSVIVSLSDDCWLRVWKMDRRNEIMEPSCPEYWGMAERSAKPMVSDFTPSAPVPHRFREQCSLEEKDETFLNSPTVRQLNIAAFLTPTRQSKGNFAKFEAKKSDIRAGLFNTKPKKLVISPRKSISISAHVDDMENNIPEGREIENESKKRRRPFRSPNNDKPEVLGVLSPNFPRRASSTLKDTNSSSSPKPKRVCRKRINSSKSNHADASRYQPITKFFSPTPQK